MRRSMRGIALIEVLIAMLIFMFGILGLVGLQASVTRAETDSKGRTDATYLASEIIGHMWADIPNLANYNGGSCATTVACKEWQDKIAATLPGGTGSIVINTSSAGNAVTVTVSWSGPGGQSHQYVTNTFIV